MSIDREIFEDAGRPDPEIAPDRLDDAVSDAIRNIDRGEQAPLRPTPPPPAPPGDGYEGDRSQSGLLKALMDERFRRQGAEERAQRYEAFQKEQRAKEQKPALSERLFADPDGTIADLRKEISAPLEERIQQMALNHDFALANVKYGETFAKAWSAWYETVKDGKDATTYFTIMNSASPAESMVSWFRRNTRDQTVGDDLDAYNQKVIDDYLANGRARDDTTGQYTARPQAPRPPTSIGRMGASGVSDEDLADNDGSEAAIFAAATRSTGKRRR